MKEHTVELQHAKKNQIALPLVANVAVTIMMMVDNGTGLISQTTPSLILCATGNFLFHLVNSYILF